MITKEFYLMNKGWKWVDDQWFDPTESWPDGMDTDTAVRVQHAREEKESQEQI